MNPRFGYRVALAFIIVAAVAALLIVHFLRRPAGPQPDVASRCIIAAGDARTSGAEVYTTCMTAYSILDRSRAAQPLRDHDAVTGSILEIYAAYAVDRSTAPGRSRSRALLRDADLRLAQLARTGSSPEVRERARSAHSCLIERAPGCLEQWSHYQ